jgi:hypothetical protein
MPNQSDGSKALPPGNASNWSALADEALEEARQLPPGAARSEAMKRAGKLRNTADGYGLVFSPKGRPKK